MRKFPTMPTREAVVAYEAFVGGCTTTRSLAIKMGIKISSAGHLRGQLEHFQAIRCVGRKRDGSRVFEAIPTWEPPARQEPIYQTMVALEAAWPIGLELPEGKARFIDNGVG